MKDVEIGEEEPAREPGFFNAIDRAWDYGHRMDTDAPPPGGEAEPGAEDDNSPFIRDADGDGVPDSLQDDSTGDRDGDGVPDSIDIDQLGFEPVRPEVPGARIDPGRLLDADPIDPSAPAVVGADPSGGQGQPPADDPASANPVGKAVDPNAVAASVGRSRGGTDQGGPSSDGSAAGSDPFGAAGATTGPDPFGDAGTPGASDLPKGGGGDSGSGSPSTSSPGDAPTGAWIEGDVQGLDDEMTVGDGWIEGDVQGLDDEMTVIDGPATDDDSGGDGADNGGKDGGTSSGADSGADVGFGGRIGPDPTSVLDAIGRSTAGPTPTAGRSQTSTTGPLGSAAPRMQAHQAPTVSAAGTVDTDLGELGSLEDTDGDGVPDSEEEVQGTDPNNDQDYLDTDGDGVPDHQEEQQGTDPYDDQDYLDTDGDGVPDHQEEPGQAESISTSGDRFGGDFYGRAKADEALAGLGAPHNGATPEPVDPSRWEGTIELHGPPRPYRPTGSSSPSTTRSRSGPTGERPASTPGRAAGRSAPERSTRGPTTRP